MHAVMDRDPLVASVLRARFGLGADGDIGGEGQPFVQIAKEMSVTKQYVHQLYTRGIRELRKVMGERPID